MEVDYSNILQNNTNDESKIDQKAKVTGKRTRSDLAESTEALSQLKIEKSKRKKEKVRTIE